MRAASISAAFLVLPFAIVWVLVTPSTVTSSQWHEPKPVTVVAPGDPGSPLKRIDIRDSDGTVDLYGNEVSDAVAKYRLDVTGSLYELHSPHTELPRLGSPKS
ncbi:MAG TPA: hypothetical protein VGY57_13510 [Vicinamibacterales bacterium]|nr:hypothetical protein [Vicinamibacterales bacterium]